MNYNTYCELKREYHEANDECLTIEYLSERDNLSDDKIDKMISRLDELKKVLRKAKAESIKKPVGFDLEF